MMSDRAIRNSGNNKRRLGLAMIEAAIFIPLLILLLCGVVEYGWCFIKYQGLNNAAREGVRTAIRDGATDAQWQAAVDAVLVTCGRDRDGSGNQLPPPSATRTLTPGVGSPAGTQLTCTVRVRYSDLTLTNTSLFPLPSQLTAIARMSKEGPEAP
jgi:Flp pilus assembly protein TadG